MKLGVSGRVALLAHFRGGEGAALPPEPTAVPRPLGVSVAGWSWGALALLEGAYAVYLLSGDLANGGTQADWVLAIGFGILAALVTRLAREILRRPSRRILMISMLVAAGHMLFAVRGVFLNAPALPFLLLGVVAFGIGWISFRALGDIHK